MISIIYRVETLHVIVEYVYKVVLNTFHMSDELLGCSNTLWINKKEKVKICDVHLDLFVPAPSAKQNEL